MNNIINTIASIFTGKGGTISFTPASDVSGQQMQTDSVHENEPEQDQMPTTVTDVQAEDKPEE